MVENSFLGKDFNSFRSRYSRVTDSGVAYSVFIVFLLFGLLLLFSSFFLGIIFIAFGVLGFFLQYKRISLFRRLSNLNEELISTISDKEVVKEIFAPLRSNNSKVYSSSVMSDGDLTENAMVLTNKRVILLNASDFDFSKLGRREFWNSIKNGVVEDMFKKKIYKKIKDIGLSKLIKSSKIAYGFNYSEISKIEMNEIYKKIIFFYRGHKYSYFVRKNDVEELKKIFKNFIVF